jgi:hypothetical protein
LEQPGERKEMWLEVEGPKGLFAIFEEDKGAGYFSAYSPMTSEPLLGSIQVYKPSEQLQIRKEDVLVMWSSDQTKCGVAIWGKMRAIMDIASRKEIRVPLESRQTPGITDPEWLGGFESYLDQNQFVRARQRYWKEMVKEHGPGTQPLPEDQTPIQTNFILYASGPNKTFAVFEDDGDSGYLYLFSATDQTVLRILHVYDRSPRLTVASENVQVMWAAGKTKCGVVIWGEMRGIIDLAHGKEGRVWMEDRDTPGIDDRDWLQGFHISSIPWPGGAHDR